MSEESRLGREAIQVSYAFKQIIDSGVRLFFYMTDQERKLDNAMDKVMLSLSNFAAEMEREKASQRTYDAMFRKAIAVEAYRKAEPVSAPSRWIHHRMSASRLRRAFTSIIAHAAPARATSHV